MNIGQQLSHYIIEGKLGDGGFGDVFRARDLNTGVEVGIKCSRPGDSGALPDQQQRFLREVSCASQLCHPNIVQLYEYGALPDGTLYLVMELVKGQNLEEIIKKYAPVSFYYAASIITQVLDALYEAHSHSIIHRDLKPANIMVVHTPNMPDTVKLLDFGIAKAFDGTQPDLTQQFFQNSVGFGTPQYMPPEQFFGKNLGPHSDLYAIALVFYELITGKQAFSGKSLSEIIQKQLKEIPKIPAPFNDGPLNDFFRQALAKDISMRSNNAREMRDELQHILLNMKWLKTYQSASNTVPYSDVPDEPLNGPTQAVSSSGFDISSCSTVLFEKPSEEEFEDDMLATVDSTSSAEINNFRQKMAQRLADNNRTTDNNVVKIGYDEFEEEGDYAPTDDMSRITETTIENYGSGYANSYDSTGLSQAPGQNIYSAEYNITTHHSMKPAGNYQPRKCVEEDLDECKTLMGASFEDELAKTNDVEALRMSNPSFNASYNARFNNAKEDELPPVFHKQKTKFLQARAVNGTFSNETVHGELSLIQRFFMTKPMIKFRVSPVGRACSRIKSAIADFFRNLYDKHFVVLVVSICLAIMIVAIIIMVYIFGGSQK